jgi:PAS domain S-box-containing protein
MTTCPTLLPSGVQFGHGVAIGTSNDDNRPPSQPVAHGRRRKLREKNRELSGRFAESAKNESHRIIVEQLRIQQVELEMQNEKLRRVRDDLEASHERFFDLYELAPVGYVTLDANGLVVQANLRAASLLGKTRSALRGRLFPEYAFGRDSDLCYEAYQRLKTAGEPQVCELRLRRAGDAPFWARLEMSLSQQKQLCLIVILDISERKLAEQRFDAFLQHSPLATSILDEEGRYVDVNPAMMRHTERSKSGWVGRSIFEVWPAGVRERLKRQHAQVLATNASISSMETLPLGNQSCIQEVIHFPFQGPRGKKLVGCITFDMTERLRLETALREANSQLATEKEAAEESTRAKSRFLSAMSHEIRTPLNGVIGMAGLLRDTPLNGEQQAQLRVVVDSSELLLRLVNDILDLSKIEAGKLELERSSFNLEDVVEDTLRLLSFAAREKSLELACWYPAEIPHQFSGDAGRIRQVLVNLISNAVKFTGAGHVVVEVEATAAPGGRWLVGIAVRDTGIGVPREKQGVVFDSFRQADASIFNRFGGTGLGLAIVKQIVELMGGTVSLSSVEGQGASFRCEIPLEAEGGAGEPVADVLQGVRVMICGTAGQRPPVTAKWCVRWGMQVSLCHAADSLRQQVEKDGCRLVILEGEPEAWREALAGVRSLGSGARPKVVLVSTGSAWSGDGVDALLVSPLASRVLRQKIGELLGGAVVQPLARMPEERGGDVRPETRWRVLVTDDNVVNQKVAAGLLARLGCEVDIADGGRAAIAKVSQKDYDVVFMDCVMPEMDGFETTVAIRKLAGKLGRVPIVALTASATTKDREKCLAVGMDDFLTKPIRVERLQACLVQWARKRES